jgi:hypothetical protein
MDPEKRKKYSDKFYRKHRDKILEKKKEEYHNDNSKLKKYWQDYYDKNKDYLKKKEVIKTRNLTFEEREKRRIYHRNYYYKKANKYTGTPAEKKERCKLEGIEFSKDLDYFVKIEEGKHIIEL